MLAPLLLSCWLLANGPVQEAGNDLDDELARKEYAELVPELLEAEQLDRPQVEAAREIISRLSKTGRPAALKTIAGGAASAAERMLKLTVELREGEVRLESIRTKLPDATGDDRAALEEQLQELEQRTASISELLPLLSELRGALFEGLLSITERAAEVEPEAAFELLSAYFKEDSRSRFALDLKVRQLKANLATVTERLPAATGDEERAELEQRSARLAASLAVRSADLERLETLWKRRIETLAKLYGQLPRGAQERELKEIRNNLRDDVPWEVRAVHVELLGHLPAQPAAGWIADVMKHAAKQRKKADDQLEELRVTYERALAAMLTSLKGGNGMVSTSVMANKNKAERELRRVSQQEHGEARVLAAAARALGSALAALPPAERDSELDAVLKLASQDPRPEVRVGAIDALGRLADERVEQALIDTLEESSSLRLRLAAIDALIAQQSEKLVELCVTSLLTDREWRMRAAAMRALSAVPRKRAVPALIDSIAVETGRLIDDAEQALFELTGRRFNGDAFLWKDWWSKHKDGFRIGERTEPGAASTSATPDRTTPPGRVSFYGISTRSNRILFVLDRSGSMNDPIGNSQTGSAAQRKIDAAKQQLKAALAGLENGDLFNIITYAVDVKPWQRRMVKRTAKVAKQVERFIDKEIEAEGGTNIHDALRDAFRLAGIGAMDKAYESNVDTIFFLTDGRPSVGEVQDPEEILLRVKDWNRLARIVVHTVGVGQDHDGSFLRRLAEENGGQYTSR